ncbi:hypothetical protein [Pseudomonas viridiflava]|uniref:hypothetical protein n=1 Tax=Pseudomonas viridiflava TaxID=33069 RepID=UPI000F06A853|nr:hypothetical protein [Pseudomonas viridiflava]
MNRNVIFERCVELSASQVLNEQQIGWSGRWTLMGDFVVCSQCLVAQPIDMAHQKFVHLPGCLATQYGAYPWQELSSLLKQIPQLLH